MRSFSSSSKLSADALEGLLLKERYRVIEKVSHGGMAWVYRGVTRDQESFALKVLFAHLAHDENARQRFQQEARIQSQWNHPNIVRVLDTIDKDGVSGIVMEWIDGPNLQQIVDQNPRPFAYKVMISLFLSLIEALGYAHAHHVVHRDLKPSNILLQQQPQGYVPKVADFGIAKALHSGGAPLTVTNNVMGTIQYMSPEQIISSKHIDHRADIYSLGAILYQLVTGRLLYPIKGMHQWAHYQRSVMPEPPSKFAPHLPKSLEFVIMRCLEKEPDKRYQDCASLRHALRATGLADPDEDQTILNLDDATSPMLFSAQHVLDSEAAGPAEYWDDDEETEWNSPHTRKAPPLVPPGGELLLDGDAPTLQGEPLHPLASKDLPNGVRQLLEPRTTPPPFTGIREPGASQEFSTLPSRDSGNPGDGGPMAVFLYIGMMVGILGIAGYWFLSFLNTDPGKHALPAGSKPACRDGERRTCYRGPLSARGKGICKPGIQICVKGKYSVCVGDVRPMARELCNGLDDDCDGQIDEDFPQKGKPCEATKGSCKVPGVKACSPDRMGLICRQKADSPYRLVQLQVKPRRSFWLYVRGKSQSRTRRYRIRGKYCILIKEPSRIQLAGRRYDSCSVTLFWRQQKLQLWMQKKSDLYNAPQYCLKPPK